MKDKNEVVEELLVEEASAEEETAIDPVVEELKAAKDQLLRLAAEFDNFRKRSAKERDEISARIKCDVIKAFLPVMDNFMRAMEMLQSDSANAPQATDGVRMIFEQFAGVFASLGAEPFGAAGDAFDPALHHAVAHVEDPEQEQSVIAEVYGKGYAVDGKLIREAVVVTRG